MQKTKLLITGTPGSGKTTLVENWLEDTDLDVAGFVTREIKYNGERVGFEIVSVSGKTARLSHRDFDTDKKVGKYGVDVDALDRIVEEELNNRHADVVIIDEIGKMELFSENFRNAVSKLWKGSTPVIATIMKGSNPFCDQLKNSPNTVMIEITRHNKGKMFDSIRNFVAECVVA